MNVIEANTIVEEIFELYAQYGAADYIGEPVSQIEHMSQAAQLAIASQADEEVILAAFFHDIGHICLAHQSPEQMDGFGIVSHEKIGADYLSSKGFSERITQLVKNHVQAKRYLTCKNPSYYAQLSEASKQTLVHQGGRMTEEEAQAFEKDPLFEWSIQMRKWDEEAKETHQALIDLVLLKEMALKHLVESLS